jgi:hypothetical protein
MSQLVKTKRQANFKDFKRFGAFNGLVEEKTLYLPRSYVNWTFLALVGVLNARFTRVKPKKSPIYTRTH